jgi:hypothetical protein
LTKELRETKEMEKDVDVKTERNRTNSTEYPEAISELKNSIV